MTNDFEFEMGKVSELLSEVYDNIDNLGLQGKQKQKFVQEIALIKGQVESATPNHSKIKSSFETVKDILEHSAGTVVGYGILHMIQILF